MTLALPGIDTLPPAPLRQAALGQWDTPPWLAREVVKLAGDIRGRCVLEPSAGLGNIVEAALDAGAGTVTAVELDPLRAAHLRARFPSHRVNVVEGDFLALAPGLPPHDAIVGNPPYDGGADTAHLSAIVDLMEAWARGFQSARPAGVSLLLRTVVLHSAERWDGANTGHRGVWSRAHVADRRHLVERVAFGEEAGKIDVSIFRLALGASREHLRRPV